MFQYQEFRPYPRLGGRDEIPGLTDCFDRFIMSLSSVLVNIIYGLIFMFHYIPKINGVKNFRLDSDSGRVRV